MSLGILLLCTVPHRKTQSFGLFQPPIEKTFPESFSCFGIAYYEVWNSKTFWPRVVKARRCFMAFASGWRFWNHSKKRQMADNKGHGEVYLQESFVATFLRTLDSKTRTKIESVSGGFPMILEKTIGFLDGGIPPRTWYSLLKMTARAPTESLGKHGEDGKIFGRKSSKIWLLHDVNSLHSRKRESEFLASQEINRDFSSLKPPAAPKSPRCSHFRRESFWQKVKQNLTSAWCELLAQQKKGERVSYICPLGFCVY